VAPVEGDPPRPSNMVVLIEGGACLGYFGYAAIDHEG